MSCMIVLFISLEQLSKWMTLEPTISLLSLIKFTNSKGEVDNYYFIQEVQHHCQPLGIQLGIDRPTIQRFYRNGRESEDACTDILDTWIAREGDVTWAALLEALRDVQTAGIARHLKHALSLYFNDDG